MEVEISPTDSEFSTDTPKVSPAGSDFADDGRELSPVSPITPILRDEPYFGDGRPLPLTKEYRRF